MSFNLRPGTSLFGNVTFTPGTNENYVAPPVHGTISTTSLTDQYYIVGAYQDDDADTDSGSVFVYDATDLSAPPTQLLHPNPVYGNKFGSALASNSNKFVIVSYGDNNYQGSIFVYDKNDLSAVPVQLTTPDAANYDFFASSDIAMSETHILAGSIGDDDGGATSSGSAYLWNLSDLSAPPTKLRPSNLIAYSKFGMNVALSDSYAIISAKGGNADTGNTDAGSGSHQDPGGIYIYDLSDLSAAPIELMAPEQGDVVGSSFGAGQGSISILGNALVVGASTLLVDGDSRAGKVYIYDMSDLSAAPTELTEPSSGYWSLFGSAVDVTETHIAVGAPRSRSGSPNSKDSGAVYIYDRSDLSASPIQLLGDDLESTSGQRPLFGQSIDLTDTTVIVGARNETVDGGNLSGAIYIWDLSDLTANSTRIISPNPAAGDGFAYSIEILTTETTTSSEPAPEPAPSANWVVVGAPGDKDNGNSSGSVYVYDANDLSAQPTKLTAYDGYEIDSFGLSVAVNSDKIVVSSPKDDDNGSSSGSVYVYDANNLSAQPTKLVPFNVTAGARLGYSVAVTANKIVAGAYLEDTQRGSVYVYDANDLSVQPTKLTAFDGVAYDRFGASVAATSDKIVVGSFRDDDKGSNSGSVYVYDANDLTTLPTKLTAFDGTNDDFFGTSVAATSDKIVVGATLDDDNGDNSGSVYVYDANDLTAQPTKLTAFDGAQDDTFGNSVAATSDKIIVGSQYDDDDGSKSGSVYVFDANDLSSQPTKLTAYDGATEDRFGHSVAVMGDKIVVGAQYNDDDGENSGSVYVYDANDLSAQPIKLTAFDGEYWDYFGTSVAVG